jgi:hypothetical protein
MTPEIKIKSNPNGIIAGREGDTFSRELNEFYHTTGTSTQKLVLPVSSFLGKYTLPFYKGWPIVFEGQSETWLKVSGNGTKTGWTFLVEKDSITNSGSIVTSLPQVSSGPPTPSTPTPTPSLTATITPTPSLTTTSTPTPSLTATITPTPTLTPTPTPTETITPTPTPTETITPTPTPTPAAPPVSTDFLFPNLVYDGGSPDTPYATQQEAIDAMQTGSVDCTVVRSVGMADMIMAAGIGEGLLGIQVQGDANTPIQFGFGINLVAGESFYLNYQLAYDAANASSLRATLYDNAWNQVDQQSTPGFGVCNLPDGNFEFVIPSNGTYFVVVEGGQVPPPPECPGAAAANVIANFTCVAQVSYMETRPLKSQWDNGGTTEYITCPYGGGE